MKTREHCDKTYTVGYCTRALSDMQATLNFLERASNYLACAKECIKEAAAEIDKKTAN